MKNFLEDNFKILIVSITIIITILILGISYYLVEIQKQKSMERIKNIEFMEKQKTDDMNQVSEQNQEVVITPELKEYGASIIQIGGIGSAVIQKSAFELFEHGYIFPAEEYIVNSFNTPMDIMWVNCKNGYMLRVCESNSNNEILNESEMCGIVLEDKLQNRINIECFK